MRIKLKNLKWKDYWGAPEVELRKKNIFLLFSLSFSVLIWFFPWLVGFNCGKGEAELQSNVNSCHGMGH